MSLYCEPKSSLNIEVYVNCRLMVLYKRANTGFSYFRCVVENKVLHSSLLMCIQVHFSSQYFDYSFLIY